MLTYKNKIVNDNKVDSSYSCFLMSFMKKFNARYFIKLCSVAAMALSVGGYSAPVLAQGNKNAPVDLQADSLSHDNSGQIVTATGDVILKQDGRTVRADKIVYNLSDDTVVAQGNVEFTDITGDKHYADRVEFNDALKNGFVEGLQSLLVDGSRFKASNGKHMGGTKTVMKDAFYTPCETCKDNPEEDPLWQIRASEVEHDKENKTISYRNARFEVKGLPVAYMPYFAHPDGTVKRKSGFLTPTAGYKSDLGAFVEGRYYWDIAPDQDATIGLMVMSRETPMINGEWRKRWQDARLELFGSTTYSERTSDRAGVEFTEDREWRGNFKADGLWDINNEWRSGIRLDLASDDQYLRQYDIDSEDVLENEIYVERFSGRNYAVASALAFQDVRIEEERVDDQPYILPEVYANFIGEPSGVPLVGGRWDANFTTLGLAREGNGQDVMRGSASLGWKRRLVSDLGLVADLDTRAIGLVYDVSDRNGSDNDPAIDGRSSEARGFGYFDIKTSYPMAKPLQTAQITLEPIVSLTAAPNISDDSDIPNEDSQDIQIDTLNIFEPNRFPGLDGFEDQTHVTYGLRTGIYSYAGSHADVFIGQSYRFDDDENPFGQGSGLNEQSSDFVGQVTANYQNDYRLDYRFQLDNDQLSSQRHEVEAGMKYKNLQLSTSYLYAKALEGTDIDETREQITNSASYNINEEWRVFGAARQDLGEDPGLREALLGVDYTGQCISLSVTGQRTLTDDSSGDSGTELFLRIGFKNLGEFKTSGLQVGDSE